MVSCPLADMEETANESDMEEAVSQAEAVSLVQVGVGNIFLPAQVDPCTPAYNMLQLATTKATESSEKQQFGKLERMMIS